MIIRAKQTLLVIGLLSGLLALAVSGILLLAYVTNTSSAEFIRSVPKPLRSFGESILKGARELPYLPYKILPAGLPIHEISIESKDLNQLLDDLPDPLGSLSASEIKAQPARFTYNGKTYDARVRFRGETSVHWLYPKKSWRVEIKGDSLPNGLRALNFIVPNGRDYLMEELNFYRAGKLGLIVPRSEFAILKVNGSSQGVYFITEHWSKEFLENAELSPDANFYGESFVNQQIFTDIAFWQKYTENPDEKINNLVDLQNLIKFIREAPPEEFKQKVWSLVDKDNFYKWLVHMTLAGSDHQDWAHNVRLYADRTTGKFMFIPWDVGGKMLRGRGIDVHFNPLISRILQIPEFKHERDRLLYEYISNDENLKDDLAYYDGLYRKTRIAFYKDPLKEFSSGKFDEEVKHFRNIIEDNVKFIQEYLDLAELKVDIYMNSRPGVILDLVTQNPIPLIIESMSVSDTSGQNFLVYYDQNSNARLDSADPYLGNVREGKDLRLPNQINLVSLMEPLFPDPTRYEIFEFLPITKKLFLIPGDGAKLNSLDILIRAKNSLTGKEAKIRKNFFDESVFADLEAATIDRNTFLARNPQFRFYGENGVALLPGSYIFEKNIIIPQGLDLTISGPANIYFAPNASLVSYGSVYIQGNETAKVKFARLNSTRPWGVFAIVQGEEVDISYAEFDGGGSARVNGAFFTGMLSAHRVKKIKIDKSVFRHASEAGNGDDAVNLKYGDILVVNSVFENNFGDALDLDFANGEVKDNEFFNNKNDGIDISGSEAALSHNFIRGSGDKGISIGEHSSPQITSNTILNCTIGIAVKDLSEAVLEDNILYGNKIALAAYKKKPVFGGAKAVFKNGIIWKNATLIDKDEFSEVSISNSNVEGGYSGEGNYSQDPELSY